MMRLNEDLSKPILVRAASLDWAKSPAVGVEWRMLYREGGEVARATSIVRYAPGGTHKPAAAEGCTIFVRLW